MNYHEKDLLKGLAENDKKAIEAIYTQHYPCIEAFIIQNNGNYSDAQDIFQEAIIVLYVNVKRNNFLLTSQLQTYIYAICKKLWLKQLQQRRHIREIIADNNREGKDIIDELLEKHKQRNVEFEIMQEALNNMGEPCKSLLKACYIEKKSMKDIAESFGYTNAANAKNQKYKCLMRLKKIFFSKYKK